MIKSPRAVLSTSRELSALHPWTPVSDSNPLLCSNTAVLVPPTTLYIGVVNIGGSRTFCC